MTAKRCTARRAICEKACRSLALCGVALVPCAVPAQQPNTLSDALQRLAAQASTLEHRLPSLTCTESILSQERRHDKIIRSVDFTAALRAERSASGDIHESFEFKTVRGKPLTGGGFVMPVYVAGGFSRALRYFAADQQRCYRYTLSGNRIDFTAAPHPPAGCHNRGTAGFALLDEAGNITHIERRVDQRYAAQERAVLYATFDLAPLTLNGTVYPMTTHMVSDQPNRGSIDHFEASYTDCKLFSATVTIGPAIETPDAPE